MPLAAGATVCPNCGHLVSPPKATDTNTAVVPTPAAQPKSTGVSPKIVFSVFGLLGALFIFLFLVIIPRAQNLSFLKESHLKLADVSDKTGKINKALEGIYSYVTRTQSSTSESFVPTGAGQVAGISTSDASEDTTASQTSLLFLKEQVDEAAQSFQNSNVKAFSTPSGDPLKIFRDLRDLATNAKESATEGKNALEALTSTIKERSSSASLAKSTNVTSVRDETDKYVSEATKTSTYYQTYSDIYIDLTPVLSDALIATSVDQLKKDLAKAKEIADRFNQLSGSSLPEEMADFHAANKEEIADFLVFLNTYLGIIQNPGADPYSQALAAASDWASKEQSLAIRIQVSQVNFWKKNPSLSSFNSLTSSQSSAIKALEKEKGNTKVYFVF